MQWIVGLAFGLCTAHPVKIQDSCKHTEQCRGQKQVLLAAPCIILLTNYLDSCWPIVDIDHNPASNTSVCNSGVALDLGEWRTVTIFQQVVMQAQVLPIRACACTQVGVEISLLIVACSSSVQPSAWSNSMHWLQADAKLYTTELIVGCCSTTKCNLL